METDHHKPAKVAMVPTPGMGHLIPLVQLAKRLVSIHRLQITIIIPNDGTHTDPAKDLLKTLPESISAVFLPPVDLSDIPTDSQMETRISLTMTRSLPVLRDSLGRLAAAESRLVALVVDMFGVDAIDIAEELQIPCFIYNLTAALTLSLFFYLPELDRTYSGAYKDMPEPVRMPGCVPISGPDMGDPAHDRNDPAYEQILHLARNFRRADGIMVNSYKDLEPGAFNALMNNQPEGIPPVYPIGPLIRSGEVDESIKWLDDQPRGSVLFVCFGSGGTLTHQQIIELAYGLEMSGQRFVWVLRKPSEKSANDAYFGGTKDEDDAVLGCLPGGFLEKTKGMGLVVPSWAPQDKILGHVSTGGFLSHCGWNSILESVVNGVPLIAWPLYAEQRMNAVLVTEGLEVAFRVRPDENGLVWREEIAKFAKELIEGEDGRRFRKKMCELKESALMAVGEDGSSTQSLKKVVQVWTNVEK